jgi:hypothetical protein
MSQGKPKERRFIMRGPEVVATLAGLKTQCRRPVQPQPTFIESSGRWSWPIPKRFHSPGCATEAVTANREWWEYLPDGCCPFGKPGDGLWVAETWQQFFDDEIPSERPRGPLGTMGCLATPERKSRVFYRADGELRHDEFGGVCWIPSVHMPRWPCRLVLELVGIRAERLQGISEEDARAEGLEPVPAHGKWAGHRHLGGHWSARKAFAEDWESINGKRYRWESNPWVWVPTYRVLEGLGS